MLRLLAKLNSSIGGGAVIIAVFSIVSKIVGLYRDRLLAASFGASRITDIYFAAFKLPDFIFNILVLGALTSSFIPVFQRIWKQDPREGIRLSNHVLNILLTLIGSLTIILFIFAPVLTPLYVPGFTLSEIHTTVVMTRLILLSLIFFTASNVLSGVLNSWHKFFSFSLSSVVYNIGIIVGIVFIHPVVGIYGLALGVILGSILHMVVQLIEAFRHGWRYQWSVSFSKPVRKIFILMIPRAIGLGGYQIVILVITTLASTLAPGNLAIFNYANNIQAFPIGIFGISLAVAAFPSFSDALAEQNTSRFKSLFATQFIRILYFLIPISFTLLLLRAHIVRVILGSGSFDWTATRLTAQTLGYFALSIAAQGLTPLLTRSFYALEDTRTPVLLSFIDIILTITLSFFFVHRFGIVGLAMASSIGAVALTAALLYTLHRRFGDLNDMQLIRSTGHIFIISVLAASIIYLTLNVTTSFLNTSTFIGIFTQGALAGIAGIGTYIVLSFIIGLEEITIIKRYVLRFIRPVSVIFGKHE